MPKGKVLRRDSLPMEFFENSKEVVPSLLKTYRVMLELGKTSEFINECLITLIPKSRDHSRIGNWHPIIFLRSIYKILAKVLSQRLEPFLPKMIKPNQKGFVKDRKNLDNFLAQFFLEWVVESD